MPLIPSPLHSANISVARITSLALAKELGLRI